MLGKQSFKGTTVTVTYASGREEQRVYDTRRGFDDYISDLEKAKSLGAVNGYVIQQPKINN